MGSIMGAFDPTSTLSPREQARDAAIRTVAALYRNITDTTRRDSNRQATNQAIAAARVAGATWAAISTALGGMTRQVAHRRIRGITTTATTLDKQQALNSLANAYRTELRHRHHHAQHRTAATNALVLARQQGATWAQLTDATGTTETTLHDHISRQYHTAHRGPLPSLASPAWPTSGDILPHLPELQPTTANLIVETINHLVAEHRTHLILHGTNATAALRILSDLAATATQTAATLTRTNPTPTADQLAAILPPPPTFSP